MSVVQLQMDELTFQRAQQVAMQRHSTLEILVKEMIALLAGTLETGDPLLGLFAQEPDLIDTITEAAMQARELVPLRLANWR